MGSDGDGSRMATILFDGVAYGMLLFVLACGLAVTLGLMNFVNLAHGAFAMAGGYTTVLLMDRAGVPFLLCLPAAFIVAAALGLLLERTLYIHMYGRSHLEQVLFSIGLVFMAVAATDYILGSSQRNITLPDWLRGRREVLGVNVGVYRTFIIVICGLLALGLQAGLMRTRFGARLRAAVDDARVARGLGIPVSLVFAATFAVGSGLAGRAARARSALPAEVHDLLPDRGHGRRHLRDHRAVRRLAAAGRRRRRGQVLPVVASRRLRHLCRADRGADRAAQRAVCESTMRSAR
jgi:branched-chain amino acid transport system permease protein